MIPVFRNAPDEHFVLQPWAPLASKGSALAWRLLRRAQNIIAIQDTTSISHLEENVPAAQVSLNNEEFAALSANPPSI